MTDIELPVGGRFGDPEFLLDTKQATNANAKKVLRLRVVLADDETGGAVLGIVDPAAGAVVAVTGAPITLNANNDTAIPFASPVYHVYIQNNTANDKYIDFDAVASRGAILLPAGAEKTYDWLVTTALHIYSDDATQEHVNDTTPGGIVVRGRV